MATLKDLKIEAKELKIKGYSKMDKPALISAISVAKIENTRKHLHDEEKARLKATRKHLEEQPNTPAEATGFHIPNFLLGRRIVAGSMVVTIIAIGGLLSYLTRPEPTAWDKLMNYLF